MHNKGLAFLSKAIPDSLKRIIAHASSSSLLVFRCPGRCEETGPASVDRLRILLLQPAPRVFQISVFSLRREIALEKNSNSAQIVMLKKIYEIETCNDVQVFKLHL